MKRVSVSDILKNTYTCLPFEGLVKSVIGTPAPNAQMMIYGSPGSQKSTFIIALCAYLQNFGKVCYKALEEGESLTFQEKLKRVGDVFDPKKVILEDEILGQKGEFAPYSFVVIDSATVVGIDATHIAAMKKAYPNTMFIYVYQCTKDGKFRGSNEIEHEVDIALKAEKGTIKQQKNRCGGVEDCTVQEMIDFAQAKSKPISGFLGNVGKIEDEGDVPGLSRVDTYWRKNKPQSLFDFDNQKIHRGTDIDAKYKYLFGETEENGFADIEEAAKTLRSDFGIQGFEFGKWTTEEDRINYLKATTITLSDIAYLLGFKKIGLSKLSICFGSRGVPRASGHFQPNELYINLSRYDRDNSFKSLEGTARKEAYIKAIASRGLPSLVHEFGHFVDCMAANIQGVRGLASGDYRASFLQNGYSVGEFGAKIDEIILAACGKNGNITTYGARLIAQDTQKDNDGNDVVVPYFQLRAEVFARIFEKWAAVKLKQNGFFNIFFTKLKHNTDDVSGNVYLTNKEFEDVQPLMDSFIAKYADAVKGNERVVSIKKKTETKVEVKPQPKPEPQKTKSKGAKMPEVKVGQRWSLRQTLQATKGKAKTFEDIIIISKIEDNKIFYKTENEGTGFVSYSRFERHFNEGDAKLLSDSPFPKVEIGQRWWLHQTANRDKGRPVAMENTVIFTKFEGNVFYYKNSDNTNGSISLEDFSQLLVMGRAKLLENKAENKPQNNQRKVEGGKVLTVNPHKDYPKSDLSTLGKKAYDAHRWTSHVPDERAVQIIDEYQRILNDDIDVLVSQERTSDIDAYIQGFIGKFSSYLSAKSNVASTMITGGSNFNVSRNEKALKSQMKRYEEFDAWRSKSLKKPKPKPAINVGQNEVITFEGGRIEINKEADRVQIFHDEKPSEEVRNKLKANAWNWSPSSKCWQRKLTDQAIKDAKKLVGLSAKEQVKKETPTQKTQPKSEDNADLDQVYRLPLNTIHTDVKRFQNRDTEFSQQSVDRIVSNFDANKLDPIVVWKDKNGKTFVLSGHSRFQAHKQLKKATIPARYFQGTEAEAKEFSRVHANRAATSEGLMADIRAFKYQRDELKRTKTDLQKEWANYHKLEAYSYLNPKGKFLENLESKASGSFPYLEMRAQWVGNLRKMYPLLTNLHENECFEYLYFDKKGSEIDKDVFINAVQTQATRLDFDPEKPLKLGKKTGTDARADTSEAQARIREIDLELKDYAAKRRVANTQEEKQAIDKFLNRLRQEREIIEKNIGLVIKTQNALFGVDTKNYMLELASKAKKQKSYNVGDYVLIKSTWGDQCFLPAKITKLGYYTDLNVLATIKRRVVQLNFDKMKVVASQIVGKITIDEYRAAMERYKLVVENAMPILPLPINWVNNFTISSPENSTLFGVKGKKTQLTPFITIAKRLVNDLGKKQHCETENVLPYNIATSIAKVIKEYPNLEKEIVESLKKAYKKDGKITKDSWQNIKNKGLNLALFGVKN